MKKKGGEINTLLQIRNVVREYKLPREKFFSPKKIIRAVDGVSMSLNYGDSFGIVGESGSGKSTLARTIMALESPQGGEICFKGKIIHSINNQDLRKLRRSFQMIFQDPYGSLDPRKNLAQIVSEPLTLFGKINKGEIKDKVENALEDVGLSRNETHKFPHEFSGGQRQRIAIARALITRPALIVADEPVSALDVSVQAQVLNLMMDLQDRHGLTYLIISHDLSVVRQVTTKVAVMYAGKIVEEGPTQTLFNSPRHPYTHALLEAIPKPDPSRKRQKRKVKSNSNSLKYNLQIKPNNSCSYAFRCPFVEKKCIISSPTLQKIKEKFENKIPTNKSKMIHKVSCYNPLNSNDYEKNNLI